ncbi:conserved oligomeric Golgi complex subunit 3 isoform X2 [Spodoptera frugiperda]|uniref:Conserved oligomeric Golgi complex subunit 3 n=1 Tax=Spodoptera frugiperda TaxID=7108 RepID=A0A9R0DYF2_SPOFR|nr:conserved oligomeric Golgi complex subunit 3 isoform X2 [Spodoptera frugiperda]
MDNMSLKEIQSKLLLWEAAENPLAPLTSEQRESILDLESLLLGVSSDLDDGTTEKIDNEESDKSNIPTVDTTYDFLEWYESLCDNNLKTDDAPYEAYHKQLDDRRNECVALTNQIGATMSDLDKLTEQYNFVSNKTNALHTMSEQLLADQNKLSSIGDDIKQKLHYFTQVEHLSQRLNSPTMSVNSETFFNVLAKIDECLEYMRANSNYKESHTYLVKYRHLQNRAISLIRSYVTHVLNHATEQMLAPKDEDQNDQDNMDTAYAVYFGKFQAAAPKLKMVISEIESRAEKNADYASLLSDIQREYAARRWRVAGAATGGALVGGAAAGAPPPDHCSQLRAACSLLAHACRDECALYYHFFTNPSPALDEYLQSLCTGLYESLRSQIIHINHLETLAELCVILRVEVIEEQVNNDPRLSALGQYARALLQDAQERLVYRAHVHLRADVLLYRPAHGDLAYPSKLLMMEQIAMSIQEQSLKRSDSRNSMISDISATSQEVANINVEAQKRPQASPADLHGMWYPGVRRTLAALSRLYRCLEKKVFQGLAQEAISLCVQSVDNAAKQISTNATNIDGELFQIKHLLILREQIAPFQVDFVVKETTLDFSNVKNAAYGLIQKPRQIFSLNSNNALLEFLLEGTPMVREHLLDSRKEVDRQLKSCCELFIKDATEILAGPMIAFIEKATAFAPIEQLKSQPWATPEEIAVAVKEAQKKIKAHLAPLQRSMQLYLANKETEFILFRPIRNNVVGYFVQIEQLLTNAGYTYEDTLIVACPTPEQVSVFISSASLISHSEPVQPFGTKVKPSVVRKPSVTSVQEKEEITVGVEATPTSVTL